MTICLVLYRATQTDWMEGKGRATCVSHHRGIARNQMRPRHPMYHLLAHSSYTAPTTGIYNIFLLPLVKDKDATP
jgi:hypothetical protein